MATDRRIVYSDEATNDLDAIWDYTAEVWGPEQADRYLRGLRSTIEQLSFMPEIARKRWDIRPPVRIHPSAKHLLVFVTDDTALTVVRVLGQRQN